MSTPENNKFEPEEPKINPNLIPASLLASLEQAGLPLTPENLFRINKQAERKAARGKKAIEESEEEVGD